MQWYALLLVGAPPGQIDPLRRLARKRARRVLAPSAKSSGGGCGDIQMNLYLCVRYGKRKTLFDSLAVGGI